MNKVSDELSRYLISTVAKRSGVKADLIRAWERRYDAVTPTRTAGGHRVYSDLDIARLKLLNQATNEGHSISQIAQLSLEELHTLLRGNDESAPQPIINVNPSYNGDHHASAAAYIEKCYAAMLAFDAKLIEFHFENAVVELGAESFMENLLTPLLKRIGDDWQAGHLRPAHEHMTTAVVRSMVYILRSNYLPADNAPRLVISTPIGQQHELGALLAALVAEFKGWHITYLGPNLPAEEIAFAAKASYADAVAISVTVSTDDHVVTKELRRLNKLIGREIVLIVGGKAVDDYDVLIKEMGALKVEHCEHLKGLLDHLGEQIQQRKNASK